LTVRWRLSTGYSTAMPSTSTVRYPEPSIALLRGFVLTDPLPGSAGAASALSGDDLLGGGCLEWVHGSR
jgi:hypothetical protein